MAEIRSASGNDAEEIVNLTIQLGYETDVNNVIDKILNGRRHRQLYLRRCY